MAFGISRLSHSNVPQRFVGSWHSYTAIPDSRHLQILSSIRSYSPDFLYQNALASVGIQAFGEHTSRTLSD